MGILLSSRAEVQGARDRLITAGLATFDERDVTCCYAIQDKVWVTDPDGNRWEVYVLLDDMNEDDHTPSEKSCCVPRSQSIMFATR